jgi:hypothetical protein
VCRGAIDAGRPSCEVRTFHRIHTCAPSNRATASQRASKNEGSEIRRSAVHTRQCFTSSFVRPILAAMARRALSVIVALALLGGAVFAVLAGWAANWLACENRGTPACARQDLASAQVTLALVGLLPALVLVLATVLGKRRLAIAAVVVGVPLYLAWALLLDAAVHGWDDLKLLP